LAAVATLAGFFGAWNYWCDLAAHFRWQYAAAFLVWTIIGLLTRRRRDLLLGLVGFAVNAALIIPWFWPQPNSTGGDSFRVVSWNMLLHNPEPEVALEQLEQYDGDLIFLMEVNTEWTGLLQAKFADRYSWRFAPREDNFGIAVLTKHPSDRIEILEWGPDQLPSARVESEWAGRPFTVFLTHPPPPARPSLARSRDLQLREVADGVQGVTQPVIVAGDFNATPWSSIYHEFESATGLRNAALGDGARSTWYPFEPWPLLGLPIDHILISEDWAVARFETGEPTGSDHCPLIADLVWAEKR